MPQDPRQPTIDAAARLTRALSDPQPGLATWHLLCERAYQDLIKAAAEQSHIVKAARVFVRETEDVAYREDLNFLLNEICLAGDPPYAANTEDDTWVAVVRQELQSRLI